MDTLTTQARPGSPEFRANQDAQRSLVADLRRRLATVAVGGPEKSRDRHVARGKLLPGDRIDRLLDPGSPFLEIAPLAANGLYDDACPAAGVISGIGMVSWRHVMVVVQRPNGQGWHLLPDDCQEAPPRTGNRRREPFALRLSRRLGWSVPAQAGRGLS